MRQTLSEKSVESDPISLFARWYERALEKVKPLPHAVQNSQPSLWMTAALPHSLHDLPRSIV